MRQKAATVDEFIESGCGRCDKAGTPECKVMPFKEVLEALRKMLRATELEEAAKWGVPCYMYQGRNVVLISALKDHCCISFFDGTLLADPTGLLQQPSNNVQHDRIVKLRSMLEFTQQKPVIEDLIQQALQLAKDGKKVAYDKSVMPDWPDELIETFELDPEYQEAFEALTPGRQKGYLLHFNQAKQAKTRVSRIAKVRDKVMAGKGMQDRFVSSSLN